MSTIKANTLQNVAASKSAAVADVVDGYAKAWVSFNGAGAPITVAAGFNVSSITDNGTGDYTVNFTNAMPSAAYAVVHGSETPGLGASVGLRNIQISAKTASSVRIIAASYTGSTNTQAVDDRDVNLAVFR